jgi:hypothetical protein
MILSQYHIFELDTINIYSVDRGWGVNSSEDARHCSVLYICKNFVDKLILAPEFISIFKIKIYKVSIRLQNILVYFSHS